MGAGGGMDCPYNQWCFPVLFQLPWKVQRQEGAKSGQAQSQAS